MRKSKILHGMKVYIICARSREEGARLVQLAHAHDAYAQYLSEPDYINGLVKRHEYDPKSMLLLAPAAVDIATVGWHGIGDRVVAASFDWLYAIDQQHRKLDYRNFPLHNRSSRKRLRSQQQAAASASQTTSLSAAPTDGCGRGNHSPESINKHKSNFMSDQLIDRARSDQHAALELLAALWSGGFTSGPGKKESRIVLSQQSQQNDQFASQSEQSTQSDTGYSEQQWPNDLVVQQLQEAQAFVPFIKGGDAAQFRQKAYQRAINVLSSTPYGLYGAGVQKQIESGSELRSMRGIGEETVKKVDEILANGALERNEWMRDEETIKAAQLFEGVWGVGRQTALQWIRHGCRNLNDVLETFGEHVTYQQLLGLMYYNDLMEKIPRATVHYMETLVAHLLGEKRHDALAEAVGSFRRGRELSSDMDILITLTDGQNTEGIPQDVLMYVLQELNKLGVLVETQRMPIENHSLNSYSISWMGLARPYASEAVRRLDIKVYPLVSYPCARLYFTGSANFNRALRHYANSSYCTQLAQEADARIQHQKSTSSYMRVIVDSNKFMYIPNQPPNSFKLDDNMLAPCWRPRLGAMKIEWRAADEDCLKVRSESEIFEALGLAYIEPHLREI